MGGIDTSFLLCQEDNSCLIDQELSPLNLDPCFLSESDDEYMLVLIEKEATEFQSQIRVNSFPIDPSDRSFQSFKQARLEAIRWILCQKSVFGFHFRTVYLSAAYLDHFISKRAIDIGQAWAIPASAVTCLSLAAKMEERKVPALHRYEVDGRPYESKAIQNMELVVMSSLEWKLSSITPFAYLDYLISKFFANVRPQEMSSKAAEVIMAMIEEINLVNHRPSAIAAAAVLVAYDDFLTKNDLESKISEISTWGSLEKEHIHSCYNLLQEIVMKKSNTPVPSNLLQKRSRTSDVSTNSSSRRRLAFNSSDQHNPSQDTCRSL